MTKTESRPISESDMTKTESRPISEIIDCLDLLNAPIAEYQISGAINSFINKSDNKGLELPFSWKAEAMAFDFVHNCPNKDTGWGNYYGPKLFLNNGDGTATVSPSIKRVTHEILKYWEERSKQTDHPILKLRYADLVWDFSKNITEKYPHFSLAHTIIDSTITLIIKDCHKYKSDIIIKLKRALLVALQINDSDRINKLKDIIIQYEDNIAEVTEPKLWGFSFDLLLRNKKIKVSEEIKLKIIQDLENRLSKLSDVSNKENCVAAALSAKAAALRLAKHYKSLNQKEKTRNVLLKLGTAFEVAIEHASAIQSSGWLQNIYSIYIEYGLSDEAEEIAIKLKEIGPKVNEEMNPISHEMEISHDDMQKHINSIIYDDLESTFVGIAFHYTPKKDQVENQLKELAQQSPISYLLTKKIQDHQGRPIAFIGSIDDDLIGNIIHLIVQKIQISIVFLRRLMEEFISRFNLSPKKVVDYLYQSPAFDENKREIIFSGIRAYMEDDHLTAIHLLIPQIESAFRKLVEHTGCPVLKHSRNGGMHLKTLDELLRDQRIINIFGKDMSLYFRILLTDQRGWNLRNDICHGISPAATFQVYISDRIFHVLLCLGLVRDKADKSR